MTKKEMIERTRQALAEFDALPPEQQVRELIANGTINEKGEVLLGRNGEQAGKPLREKGAKDNRA